MNSKWLVAVVLIIALFLVCGASVLALWQGARMISDSDMRLNIGANTVAAESVEEKTLAVSGQATLTVDNALGNISVVAGPAGEVAVTAEKKAWGRDEADAQEELKALKVNILQTGDRITISVVHPVEVDFLSIGPSGGAVNFTITVPEDTEVELDSSNGNLSLDGVNGGADLYTSFGKIDVQNAGGKLTVKSSNGSLQGENIQSKAEVSFSSDFGDITLSEVSADQVDVSSTNGKLELSSVESADEIRLSTEFGRITLKDSQAQSLDVQTSNGDIRLENVTVEGKIFAKSQFGGLTLEQALGGSYDLSSSNGKINVDGAGGEIKAHSDFGDLEIMNAEGATLDLSTNNGKISFSGSLSDGPHTLKSDFGNISLTLPADSSLNVDLQTDFGKIVSDFAIQVSGELDSKHWQGAINGGEAVLTAKTNNGNINLIQSNK